MNPPLNPHSFRKMMQAQDNMRRAMNLTRREENDGGEVFRWNGNHTRQKAQRRQSKWAYLFLKWSNKVIE